MFAYLLPLHSWIRWILLLLLLISLVRSYYGWKKECPFTQTDSILRQLTVYVANVQLLIGIGLYSLSPIVKYFYQHFSEGVHLREIRFFGMEHSLMMLTAVSLLSIGAAKSKLKVLDKDKFKTIWVWFGIALLIILSSIPWFFWPLVSRPAFRWF